MFPILVLSFGVAVLAFGSRLTLLGSAVGALLGVGLLRLFPGSSDPLLEIAVVGSLAVVGFIVAGFAKGIVDIMVLGLGALAGAAIVLGFLDLLRIDLGLLDWLLAVLGGVVGLVMIKRSRNNSKDWGILILAGLVGALLVTRGLTIWMPVLHGALGTVLVVGLAGGSIALHGGFLSKRRTAAPTPILAEGSSPIATEITAPPSTE